RPRLLVGAREAPDVQVLAVEQGEEARRRFILVVPGVQAQGNGRHHKDGQGQPAATHRADLPAGTAVKRLRQSTPGAQERKRKPAGRRRTSFFLFDTTGPEESNTTSYPRLGCKRF